MYAATRVLESRMAHSGTVVKKLVGREMAFQLIREALTEERLSDISRKANLMDKDAIQEIIDRVHKKIYANGISIQGMTTDQLANDYVHATYALDVATPYYFLPDTEEIYFNAHDEIHRIVNNRREYLPLSLPNEETLMTILRRITRGAKEGAAGENNSVGNARLLDGTRVAWTCPPVSIPSFNLRKHAPPDRVGKKYYVEYEVMSEEVFDVLVALMLADAAGGIIGEGAVGKSTLIKALTLEMNKIYMRRIIVLERLAELGLRHYFRYHLKPGEYDVLEMEAQPGQGILKLFTNTKQRAAQLLIQAEVLGGEEVENMKALNRSGHSAGLFTGHFYPHQFIEGLAGLAAEYKKLDHTTLEEQDLRKIIQVAIQMESTKDYPRKVTEVWEYGPDVQKPIISWKKDNQYEFNRIESSIMLLKLEKLKYRFPDQYRKLETVGLV